MTISKMQLAFTTSSMAFLSEDRDKLVQDLSLCIGFYKSDIWLPGAFRHPMGLPDHLLPSQWKNL